MNISILLPTKKRVTALKKLLESIMKTASNPEDIEVVIYMDEDDPESHDVDIAGLTLKKIIKPPGSTMGRIFTECYRLSKGRYIMLMNDDCVFLSQGWDRAIIAAFKRFPDDVALVYGNDLDRGRKTPTFPVVSRSAAAATGWEGICPPDYVNLHIESHILDVFKRLEERGHKRIVYLYDLIFEHRHYSLGKSAHDSTSVKKAPSFDDRVFISFEEERAYAAKKLERHIKEQGGSAEGVMPINDGAKEKKPEVSVIITGEGMMPFRGGMMPFRGGMMPFANGGHKILKDIIARDTGRTPFEVILPHNATAVRNKISAKNVCIKEVAIGLSPATTARLCNLLAASAKGEYIAFLSPTVITWPGWLDRMAGAMKLNSSIAAAGCKIVSPRNLRILHAGICFFEEPDKGHDALLRGHDALLRGHDALLRGHDALRHLKATYVYRGLKADTPAVNKMREFQAVSGAAMMVRKDAFLKAGGFTEEDGAANGLPLGADIDLCVRLRMEGGKIVYVPEASVYEHGVLPALFVSPRLCNAIKEDLIDVLKQDNYRIFKTNNGFYEVRFRRADL